MPLGKYNKVRSNSDFTPMGKPLVGQNAKGPTGVYDHNPSPGLASYPASIGPGDISTKFAETGVGDANSQKNQLRMAQGVKREGTAPLISSSNMNKKKNPYRRTSKPTSMK